MGNAAGTAETSAAATGTTPTASSGRYAAVQSIASAPAPADVFIGYSVCNCLNVQIGQFDVPFSLANRTGDDDYPLHRAAGRHPQLRGAEPARHRRHDLGRAGSAGLLVRAGRLRRRRPEPTLGRRPSRFHRAHVPAAVRGRRRKRSSRSYTQIGVSARHGDRDPTSVGYDAPAITTGQGFVLWSPTYTDSLNRLIHVIPSGAQNEIGGELRFQSGRFALQGEAYYVVDNTREAVDGYQLANTERFGRIAGVGWYAQVSAWPLGDAFVAPEPGIDRPRHVDFAGRQPPRAARGLEMIALVSGINASYRGATRLDSTPDTNTPMSDITVYQIGVAANYWYTRHVRFGVDYMAYVTPGSGTPTVNQAVVPDNLTQQGNGAPNPGHVLHELGARLAVTF